ncbi:MAG: phenylalanine--tRNA ligase subunit beta [Clostridia bacterium]|nr:phenylalanine--tRNA ligase subunit beta [Clostridia bacterium]
MNLSKKWLLDYVDLCVSDKEFCDALTLSGSKVEAFKTEGSDISNIIVGKIISLTKHEDSDHLWVCSIDVGASTPIQIVTGAQNLKQGDIVPVAMDNSVVYGGKEIKAGTLRGVESSGMLCSLTELGLTINDFPYAIEDGIFVLGDDCDKTLGIDICEAIGLNDVVTEFEITSNRPDCLSIIGLARETAATFDLPFAPKTPQAINGTEDVKDYLKVEIAAADKCYRYVGAVVKNVRIAPSPRWIRERLRACGVRPINNIVDITNYVMLEYGQPMHAFDLRYLEGNQVIVRTAKTGEQITTLDGNEHTLDDRMLVIADREKPVAVAGVMGGEYSGIMQDTATIVFESACFNGPSVRKTAKKLGMRTESSGRFEKQLNPLDCDICLYRALELVKMLDAGDIINGVVDCDYSSKELKTLPFNPKWVNDFIGIDVSAGDQKKILERIGFTVENDIITVPSFRNDIEHQADISEEIARFYGYENIPNRELSGVANGALTSSQLLQRKVEDTLLACGYSEIATYSFVSPKVYDKICLAQDDNKRNCVVITNPLGEDTSVMRTTAIPSMLDVLARNYNNRNMDVAFYEVATQYTPQGNDSLPIEKPMIILGEYGDKADFFSLKGAIEELLRVVGIDDYDIEAVTNNPTFHPGRTAAIIKNRKQIALFGEIHPQVLDNYDIGSRVYIAEVDFNQLFENRIETRSYKPLPKFPATTRDLAFVCDDNIPVLTLEKAIATAVGDILENISLFDVYQGSQIPQGKKSVAFNLKLRSALRTLTDDECDKAMNNAILALGNLGITLRA